MLDILVLSSEHEQPNRILARLVEDVAPELGSNLSPLGSMTFKRKELQKGFEPDRAFYIGGGSAFWGPEVDPALGRPPDLVIEIEPTDTSTYRQAVFCRR